MKLVVRLTIFVTLLWIQMQVASGQVTISCDVDPNGQGNQEAGDITADCAVLESDGCVIIRVAAETTDGGDGGAVIGPPGILEPPGDPGARKRDTENVPDVARGMHFEMPPRKYLSLRIDRKKRATTRACYIETGPVYDVSDPSLLAEVSVDYAHVTFFYNPELDYEFIVPIIRDDEIEGPELFQVCAYGEGRRKRDTSHPLESAETICVKILIIDDDVSFHFDCCVFAIDEDKETVTFHIIRQGKFDNSQSVGIRTEDITAVGGIDYVSKDETLSFSDAVSDTIEGTIDIICDFEDEGPEAFKIIISFSSEGVVVEPSNAEVIILDFKPTVPTTGMFTFDKNHYEAAEGNAVTIQVYRKGDMDSLPTVYLQTSDIEAHSPNDYTMINNQLVSFDTGDEKSHPITIATEEDTIVEHQESFEVALVSDNEKISTATVWIHDDDVNYCFESKVCVVREGDSSVTLTIEKKGNLQDTSDIRVTTDDIDATSSTDYIPHRSTVSIPSGDSTVQIHIPIEDDENWEPNECFSVTLETDDNNKCTATVLIKDDDALCDTHCKNGGTCVAPNTCLCSGQYTGLTCETALCHNLCQNGGICIEYTNKCWCPPGFAGDQCEKSLCDNFCQNGGICFEYTNKCWCPLGFTGDQCEVPLCVKPCLNGGVCAGNEVCLCPSGFSGKWCQTTVSMINGMSTSMTVGQISIITINDNPATYIPQLNVEGSPEREELLAMIVPLLNEVLRPLDGLVDFNIGNISPGSINVEYTVITESDSSINAGDVDNAISNLQAIAPRSGVVINPDSSVTFTRDICPDGYCMNGGTCMADGTGMGSVCMCTGRYSGLQCETSELSAGDIGAIVAAVVVSILLMILMGICFLYMRNKAKHVPEVAPHRVPNLNTLDLVPYPYQYPRLDANVQTSMIF